MSTNVGKYVGKIHIVDRNDTNNIIDTVSPIGTTLLGTCGSSASASVKKVKFDGDAFQSYTNNITIKVKFADTNTFSMPKLQIVTNDENEDAITDALVIKTYDSSTEGEGVPGITPNSSWYAGEVVTFTYIQGSQGNPSFWYMSRKGGVDVKSQTVVTGIAETSKTTFSLNGTTLNITTTNVNPSTANINVIS